MVWIYGLLYVAALAKWAGAAFLAAVPWTWILWPLAALILWFEIIERLLGMDRRREVADSEAEKARQERIAKQLNHSASTHSGKGAKGGWR